MKVHIIFLWVLLFAISLLLLSRFVAKAVFSELSDFESKLVERISEDLETKKVDTDADLVGYYVFKQRNGHAHFLNLILSE